MATVVALGATRISLEQMYLSGISTGTTPPSGLPVHRRVDPVSRQAMAAFL